VLVNFSVGTFLSAVVLPGASALIPAVVFASIPAESLHLVSGLFLYWIKPPFYVLFQIIQGEVDIFCHYNFF
jgi:hypothetical protein